MRAMQDEGDARRFGEPWLREREHHRELVAALRVPVEELAHYRNESPLAFDVPREFRKGEIPRSLTA
jgi:hypothetical protein